MLQRHLGIRYYAFLQCYTLCFSFYTLFLLKHVLLAAPKQKAKGDDKVVWNKIRIAFIAFVPLCTLCRRLYTLFSQERILITARQGKTAKVDSKRTWNRIRMLPRHLGKPNMQFCTLFMSSCTLFLLEHFILAAHQGKRAKRDYKET